MARTSISLVLLSLLISFSIAQDVHWPLQCRSFCDPHIDPFPGGRSDVLNPGVQYPGQYILAIFGPVTVYEHHADCGGGLYCNDKVAIVAYGWTVAIEADDVYVNGVYSTPFITPDLDVGSSIHIHKYANAQYQVKIDGSGWIDTSMRGPYLNIDVYVAAPPLPSGGLCTEFVGDNRCPKGYSGSLEDFSCSWAVSDDSSPFPDPNAPPTHAPDTPPATPPPKPEDQSWEEYAAQLCAPLLDGALREQCGPFVNVELFYQACFNDVFNTHGVSFSGGVIDAYASKCAHTPEGESFDLPTSAIASTASGEGLNSPVRAGSHRFTIQTKDVLRRDRRVGGDSFVITSNGPSTPQFTVDDQGNGQYVVTYTVRTSGVYSIGVWFRGSDPIADSPFTVIVQ